MIYNEQKKHPYINTCLESYTKFCTQHDTSCSDCSASHIQNHQNWL